MFKFGYKLELFGTKNYLIKINFPHISSNLMLFYILNNKSKWMHCLSYSLYEIKFILEINKFFASQKYYKIYPDHNFDLHLFFKLFFFALTHSL